MKRQPSSWMERLERLGLRASIAIFALAVGAGALMAQPPRGVYIYSGPITAPPSGTIADALRVNGVDGVTLVFDWSVLQPTPAQFTWDPGQTNLLDPWLDFVAALGKNVRLSIRGGLGNLGTATPSWLFTRSALFGQATPLFFEAASHEGIGSCIGGNMAAPWDPVFQLAWQNMVSKLSKHLTETGKMSIVKMVRLTGINRSTDEFRLPEENEASLASCAKPVSSIQTWLSAGYTPANLAFGWKSIVDAFAGAFPNQYVDAAIIPNNLAGAQNPFPEIDSAGCVYSPPVPISDVPQNHCIDTTWQGVDQNRPLLEQASSAFGDRLVIEFENLNTSSPPNAYSIAMAQSLGAGSAFQTNNYLGGTGNGSGAACSGTPGNSPMPCATADDYYNLIERGIYLQGPQSAFRALYLEVFDNDVLRTPVSGPPFACAIWKAHIALTDYTSPVTTAQITKQTETLPHGISFETIVTFASRDGSTRGQPDQCSPLPVTTFFQIDNGDWQTGDNYTFSTPGKFRLNFYSVDFAGNVEPVKTITVENL